MLPNKSAKDAIVEGFTLQDVMELVQDLEAKVDEALDEVMELMGADPSQGE